MSIWFFIAVLVAAVLSLVFQIFSAVFDFLSNAWQFLKTVFFIIFIAAIIIYIIGFIVYMVKNIKNKRNIFPSLLCIISGLMIFGTLFRLWAINKFFLLSLLILLETLLSYLLFKSGKIAAKSIRVPLMVLLGISIFLPSLWTMGYDLNYFVVTQENNVAYYYCEEILYSYSDEAHPVFDDDGNIIGAKVDREAMTGSYLDRERGAPLAETYAEGDSLRPDRSSPWVIRDRSSANEYNLIWYPVITPSGVEAYVSHSGLAVYYRGAGVDLQAIQDNVISNSWYMFCPDFIRSIGKTVFDLFPLWYHANVAQDVSSYL